MSPTPATEFDAAADPIRGAWRDSFPGLAAIGVFSMFINVLRLATPLYVLQILDRVVASRSLETLFMLTAITLAAIVAGVSLEVVRRRMFLHWGNWIERIFGPGLFAAGLRSTTSSSSATSSALRDIRTLRSFVSGTGLISWLDVCWAPLFLSIVFLISPTLGAIALLVCVIALVLGAANELAARDAREATHEARKDDREWIASAERNRESLGSANMATNFAGIWARSAFARLDEGMRTQSVNVYFSSAMRLAGRFLRIGMMGVGIWLVIDDVLTLGAVVAASVLGRTAYRLVRNAMQKWRDMVTAKRAYRRIKTSLNNDSTPAVSLPGTATPAPLVLDRVGYRYPGQANSVFRHIDLTLNPGEVLCVVGPSATGKTTFARLVAGLIAPRSGKILLDDVDVSRLQQADTQREIGFLPQDFTLFQGSVRENIARMSEGDIDEVVRAAKLAGIHETILQLPAGYDTEISESEPLLSSGQRKSVALARALYGSPPLIVLDEPTPHLDRRTRSALLKGIQQLQARGTMIIVTMQSKSLTRIADKIVLLTGGKHKVLQTIEDIDAVQSRHRTKRRSSRHVRLVPGRNEERHESD